MLVDFFLLEIPHYRQGLVERLNADQRIQPRWIIGTTSSGGSAPIPAANVDPRAVVRLKVLELPMGLKWQLGAVRLAVGSKSDAVVLTGDPRIVSNWFVAAVQRLKGVRCLMWTHGWTRLDKGTKKLIRMSFYRLADGLLLYGQRAVKLGNDLGYSKRMFVIYNSTDVGRLSETEDATVGVRSGSQKWVIVSRLTKNKGFGRVLQSINYLKGLGRHVELTVVGDGPDRLSLEQMAEELDLDVRFHGAVYDHNFVNSIIEKSDILVSPLNVGLSAIHAMTLGCPVATSELDDEQMPEAEAVRHLINGVKFDPYSVHSMATQTWDFIESSNREDIRQSCISEVTQRWTAESQADRIVAAIQSPPVRR